MEADKERYCGAMELWRDWNAKINVISRKDADNIYEHHILHSLAIAEYIRRIYGSAEDGSPCGKTLGSLLREGGCPGGDAPTVLDLGCGGGFPGIPLAMEWPSAQFTLCDSVGKKVRVAGAVAEGLGLKNVQCVQARAEELPGEWDLVVSRAVAPLDTLYGWVKGRFRCSLVCLKGGDVNEEISALLRRFGRGRDAVSAAQVRTWPISDWLDDEYFKEKFVIEVGKSYLCNPLREKI